MCLSLSMQCQRAGCALGYCSDCDDEWRDRFIYASVSGHSGRMQYPVLPVGMDNALYPHKWKDTRLRLVCVSLSERLLWDWHMVPVSQPAFCLMLSVFHTVAVFICIGSCTFGKVFQQRQQMFTLMGIGDSDVHFLDIAFGIGAGELFVTRSSVLAVFLHSTASLSLLGVVWLLYCGRDSVVWRFHVRRVFAGKKSRFTFAMVSML